MQITLAVIAGPHAGQTFTFDRPERFLVGRAKQAHFRLLPDKDKDLRVSRVHFLIEMNPPLCQLYDLNSRNGTHVNGARVAGCALAHGDEIRVGRTILRVAIKETPTLTESLPGVTPPAGIPRTVREILPAASPPGAVPVPQSPAPVSVALSYSLAPGGPCLCCSRMPHEVASPLCAGCRQQAEAQEQPIPGYLLLRELGKGSMGVVYLALRQREQQLVAVKTIVPASTPEPGVIERFLREAEILKQLSHRYIVSFQELGKANGLVYFAMDYVAGSTAAQLVQERGHLPLRLAVRLMLQVLQALEYAHEQHFVHRDIKPGNILLDRSGEHLQAKVADFGLARIYQASRLSGLTLENSMGGTLEFMPPEQITGFRDVKPAADQFSAAATLYNMLTGQFIRDLTGNLAERIDQILTGEIVPIRQRQPDLPQELADVIHRALEHEPERRYPSVHHLRLALRPFGL